MLNKCRRKSHLNRGMCDRGQPVAHDILGVMIIAKCTRNRSTINQSSMRYRTNLLLYRMGDQREEECREPNEVQSIGVRGVPTLARCPDFERVSQQNMDALIRSAVQSLKNECEVSPYQPNLGCPDDTATVSTSRLFVVLQLNYTTLPRR